MFPESKHFIKSKAIGKEGIVTTGTRSIGLFISFFAIPGPILTARS